jgi:hypothetical protein
MLLKSSLILIVLLAFVTACTAEPETVVQTVVSEVTVEIEITRVVEVTSEVTREVEITREVPVEVTRIVEVERVITATPKPTPEPTATPEPTNTPQPVQAAAQPTAVPQDVGTELIDTMFTLRGFMQSYGGMIDSAVRGDSFSCWDAVNLYDTIVAAPTFNVSGSNLEVQSAYGSYRASVDVFADGVWDLANNCRELLSSPENSTTIPAIQWTLARDKIDEAIHILSLVID